MPDQFLSHINRLEFSRHTGLRPPELGEIYSQITPQFDVVAAQYAAAYNKWCNKKLEPADYLTEVETFGRNLTKAACHLSEQDLQLLDYMIEFFNLNTALSLRGKS